MATLTLYFTGLVLGFGFLALHGEDVAILIGVGAVSVLNEFVVSLSVIEDINRLELKFGMPH